MSEKKTCGGCYNLNELYGDEKVVDAFSLLVSGKKGYKAVEAIPKKRCNCGYILKGSEKFCPECGNKAC